MLDKADALRRKRRRALDRLDDLLQAVFLDMFGDPVTNPKGWEIVSLSKGIEFLTSGSRGWAKYYSDEGSLFIRIQNVKNGRLDLEDVQYVTPPESREADRTRVEAGDLLISITADLGRTAIVEETVASAGAHINQHLALLRLNDLFVPLFASAYLESIGGKRQFERLDQVGVKSGLNFDAIKSLRLFRPPIQLQRQYRDYVARIRNLEKRLSSATNRAQELFNALMQKAFTGGLDFAEDVIEDADRTHGAPAAQLSLFE